jgi:hypothetical protein
MSSTHAIPFASEPPLRPPNAYDWPLAYDAEALIRNHIADFLKLNSFARHLAEKMEKETGTDFFEWTDHLVLGPDQESNLLAAGYVSQPFETDSGKRALEHPQATLPRVLISEDTNDQVILALRPEFVADFIARHNLLERPEGDPGSRYRRVLISEEAGARLEAVERRAYCGFTTSALSGSELKNLVRARELWKTRVRLFQQETDAFIHANEILNESIDLAGRDISCQFFFEAERAYWESRNRAARIQKFRQDALGLGWGNHDHHTFRCSREHFVDLIEFLLKLGFQKRERYYAGAEAGWGAQICEQPVAGIVVFADVDLLPEETTSISRRKSCRLLRSSARWDFGLRFTAKASFKPGCITWKLVSISIPFGNNSARTASI